MYRLFVILSALFSPCGSWHRILSLMVLTLSMAQPTLGASETEPIASPLPTMDAPPPSKPTYRYVADEFRITLRRGPAATFKVVTMLKTGRKLTLLESGKEGWDRVQTEEGKEGWVLRRFITDKAPAKIEFSDLQATVDLLLKERDALRERLDRERSQSTKRIQELEDRLTLQSQAAQTHQAEKETVEKELEQIKSISARALELERQNKGFQETTKAMERQLIQLSAQNSRLAEQANTRFFLVGAAVLSLGIIMGIILSRRRRSRYDTL